MHVRSATESLKVADEPDRKGTRPRSVSRSSTGSRSKFTNSSLPFSLGTGRDKSWRGTYCHTFFEYMGTADDPWTVEESYVKAVWEVVYADLELVDEDDIAAVTYIVSERMRAVDKVYKLSNIF